MKKNLAQPDPLRLTWLDFIKNTIRELILNCEPEALSYIKNCVKQNIAIQEQAEVQALIIQELRRLHEGVLARYGLRPAQYETWKVKYQL